MEKTDERKAFAVASTGKDVTEGASASPATAAGVAALDRAAVQDLSTVELVKQITAEVGHLAQKQIELAKTELKADLKAEMKVVGGLGVAALAGLTTINLLFVAAVLALSLVWPGWLAGLAVAGFMLVVTAVVAAVSWSMRVRSPLARTKKTLREDVQWTKERLV